MTSKKKIAAIELKIEQLIAKREELTGEANRGPFVPIPDENGNCGVGWYNDGGVCRLNT